MSLSAVAEIASSVSLRERIIACAAQEGEPDPVQWARDHVWAIAASPGWDDNWDYAKASSTPNTNPDIGGRDDVITDAAILSAVQAQRSAV
jgi:hypothetical protein